MGSLILTIIELAKTIIISTNHEAAANRSYPHCFLSITVTTSMSYILRFLFHCVQYTFLFRYGNVSISSSYQLGNTTIVNVSFHLARD